MNDKITKADAKTITEILGKWDKLSDCQPAPGFSDYNLTPYDCSELFEAGYMLAKKLKRMAAMPNNRI